MIENVTKSVNRKEEINEAYMDKLFANVISLYRLDQLDAQGGGVGGKQELGPLPGTAVWLLSALACTWILIIGYILIGVYKRNRAKMHKNLSKTDLK